MDRIFIAIPKAFFIRDEIIASEGETPRPELDR